MVKTACNRQPKERFVNTDMKRVKNSLEDKINAPPEIVN
jgi:hypothetical protein